MTDADLSDFVSAASDMADAAGRIVAGYFRQNPKVDRKADGSMVSAADREAEAAIRAIIADRFPDHGVIGEELGQDGANRDYVWVLDPLDGTHAYLCGLPLFGILIALCRAGRPILGIIDQPVIGERWLGVEGRPTSFADRGRDPKEVKTRRCSGLADAVLFATTPAMFTGTDSAGFEAVSNRAGLTRFGTDCYGYAMIASGHGDLTVEAGNKIHDYLAVVPVVTGAGGVVSDWDGAPLTIASGDKIIAAGDAKVHREALALLNEAMS